MKKNVAVPLPLLETILRLLDNFDDLEGQDFHKCGYNPRFDHYNAIWELRTKIRQLQRSLVETYLLTIGDITETESRALHEWVETGNSVYSNPDFIYDGSGQIMDFVSAYRIADEVADDPSSFFGCVPDTVGDDNWDDELPF